VGGLLFIFITTLTQTYHSGRKEAMIIIYGYRSARGVVPDLFVCMMYVAPVGSKHDYESLFQNLTTDIVEVQTLGRIVLLGEDFNTRTVMLPNTINTSNLCELL